MVSTLTSNVGLEKPANGDYVNTWSTPVNSNYDVLDTCIGGVTSLNATGASGTTVLTVTQYRSRLLKISGTLTANVTYQIPSGVGGFWFIQNSTTGAFTVTLSSGGAGTSLALAQGYTTPATSDGTNIAIGYSAPATVAAAGSNTQVQFNSSGSLGASSNLTWNSSTNTLSATNVSGTFSGNLTGNVTGSVSGTSANVTGVVALANGGTGGTTQATARSGIGAAASGVNTDITSLLESTTVASGGTIGAGTLGFRGVPPNSKTASYTLALTDQSQNIYLSGSSAGQTITIPANASVAFPAGATIRIMNDSSVSWSIAITSDTLFWSPSGGTGTRTLASGAACVLEKTPTSTRWWISGSGLS